MKYQPPFKYGVAPAEPGIHNDDADAPYVNGDPATGTEGSVPPMESVAHPMSELVHLIEHSGQEPDHEDLEQVRKAIRHMIDTEVQVASVGGGVAIYQGQSDAFVHRIRSLIAGSGITIELVETAPGSGLYGVRISSGGGGDGEGDVTQWQRLPIFPEIETSTGKLGITDNANGTITVQASQNVLWRGWDRVSTDTFSSGARTLTHLANKTYHLRYVRSTGFVLKDLSDSGYNAGALTDANAAFDTIYDDMLVARVVTNGSNVPTIKPLVNRNRLKAEASSTGAGSIYTAGTPSDGVEYSATFTLDWARAPVVSVHGWVGQVAGPTLHGFANAIYYSSDRYAVAANVSSDFNTNGITGPYGYLRLTAFN
jgi:hypothetical protein